MRSDYPMVKMLLSILKMH